LSEKGPDLTRQETRVLELIAAGLSTKDAAVVLCVTAKDVDYHISNLISKFDATNRTGVVSRAYVLGYLHGGIWPPRAAAGY
jgi:DNA-binding NarL/FixJ family response regulator